MPRDDSTPVSTRAKEEAARPRAALVGIGAIVLLVAAYVAYRTVALVPGTAQTIVISRGGSVSRILQPGEWAILNPFSQVATLYDTAIRAADRSAPDRGMQALSAEGHLMTVFGTAFWHEGGEEDLRWRFAHIRSEPDMLQPLMASSVATVMGRHPMDEIVRNAPAIASELAAELRDRARELLRVEVTAFPVTRIDPGESYRAVVSEREMGRARAASVAASPAVTGGGPNALEVERIRRWDGRGIIPDDQDVGGRRSGGR